MKTSSAKDKGRRLQKFVVAQLIERLGIDEEDVESRSMGAGGEDVIMSSAARKRFPFSIECKNTEKASVWSWIQQAKQNGKHYEPIVIFKRNRSKEYVLLNFEAFLDILSKRNDHLFGEDKTRQLIEKQRDEIEFLKDKLMHIECPEGKDWDRPKKARIFKFK